jgi:hypothetical protein
MTSYLVGAPIDLPMQAKGSNDMPIGIPADQTNA